MRKRKQSWVNIDREKKVNLEIRSQKNNRQEHLDTIIKKLVDYVNSEHDKKEFESDFQRRVLPLLENTALETIRAVDTEDNKWLMILQTKSKYLLTLVCSVGFLLHRYLIKKGLQVISDVEDLEGDELEKQEKIHQALDYISSFTLMGMEPSQIVKEFINEGILSMDDIKDTDLESLYYMTEEETVDN